MKVAGATTSDRLARERVLGLASMLELNIKDEPPKYEQAVNTATLIRNMVREGTRLTGSEKVRLIRSLAMLKAKVYARRARDSYLMYKKLDSISEELIKLL